MDAPSYIRFLVALVAVLALIAILAQVVRRTGIVGHLPGSRSGRKRRLGVEEQISIDAKRRVVLVRRDDHEHLLLIGGQTDLVIETGIEPPADARAAGDQTARVVEIPSARPSDGGRSATGGTP